MAMAQAGVSFVASPAFLCREGLMRLRSRFRIRRVHTGPSGYPGLHFFSVPCGCACGEFDARGEAPLCLETVDRGAREPRDPLDIGQSEETCVLLHLKSHTPPWRFMVCRIPVFIRP